MQPSGCKRRRLLTVSEPRPLGEVDRPSTSLFGRDDELIRLYRIVEELPDRGGAFVVRGEAGIGKSELLAAASEWARSLGVAVLSANGVESEAQLPFAGLHQLLLPSLNRTTGLPAPQRNALEMAFGLAAPKGARDVFLIGLATLGLISEMSADGPVLLTVDDAQWLDRSSANALAFVARRLEWEPAALLIAVRDGVPSDLDEVGLTELAIERLDDDAARSLLDLRGAHLSEDLKIRVLKEAAGNPLALTELPLAASSLKREPTHGSGALPLTARLERAFAARLGDLDADARALLLVAALDEAEPDRLMAAAERFHERPIGPDAWTPAEDAGLGKLDSNGFQFRHPLVRSAVEQTASAEERRRAHAALATVLADDPDRATWHAAGAAPGPDEHVALQLEAAAERAQLRGAHAVAATVWERSARLTPDVARRALRLHRAAQLAWELGRSSDSARLFRESNLLGLPSFEQAEAAHYLETFEGSLSSADAALRAFVAVAEQRQAAGDDRGAIKALESVLVRVFWGELSEDVRRDASELVKGLDVPLDDPLRLSSLGAIDPVRHGADVIQQLRTISAAGVADALDAFHLGYAGSVVWAPELTRPFLRTSAGLLRADGRLGQLGIVLAHQAWNDLHFGATRAAIAAASEAAQLAEDSRFFLYVPASRLAEAIAIAERGDRDTAEDLIAEMEAILLTRDSSPLLTMVAIARGRAELAAGRFTEAFGHLSRLFDHADVAYHRWASGTELADLVEAAVHGGEDLVRVRALLPEWRQIAAATRSQQLHVQLAYATAMLASDSEAEESFQAAIASGSAAWPFFSARAKLAFGAWLRRQRRAAESRLPLRQAAETFDALGQMSRAVRARRELRASGETARRRTPGAWAQLTPQELQVAQLAAEGLSNKEVAERLYLSTRTVGTHLYRLFPKLGITSRAELRDALPAVEEA
jgi:DNA-binding CsgD family transcriptional regulator